MVCSVSCSVSRLTLGVASAELAMSSGDIKQLQPDYPNRLGLQPTRSLGTVLRRFTEIPEIPYEGTAQSQRFAQSGAC